MAFTARSKIRKEKGKQVTAFEDQIAGYIFELQSHASSNELKNELKTLVISAAREVDAGEGKKAAVIFVPYPQLKDYRRIQVSLVGELEKKLSGRPVFILAQRRIIPKITKTNQVKQQRRPRSRTLTAVHDAILDDIVFPSEVTGKRIRIRVDGSKHQKVILDSKEQSLLEGKLSSISTVYSKLTGKNVDFTFNATKE
jgi:small subunit ribosomal protein S7e